MLHREFSELLLIRDRPVAGAAVDDESERDEESIDTHKYSQAQVVDPADTHYIWVQVRT